MGGDCPSMLEQERVGMLSREKEKKNILLLLEIPLLPVAAAVNTTKHFSNLFSVSLFGFINF